MMSLDSFQGRCWWRLRKSLNRRCMRARTSLLKCSPAISARCAWNSLSLAACSSSHCFCLLTHAAARNPCQHVLCLLATILLAHPCRQHPLPPAPCTSTASTPVYPSAQINTG